MKVIVDIDSEETKKDMTKYAFRSTEEIRNWLRKFPEYKEEGDDSYEYKAKALHKAAE